MLNKRRFGMLFFLVVVLLLLTTMLATAQQGEVDKGPPPIEAPEAADLGDESEVVPEASRAADGDAELPGEMAPAAVEAFDAVNWRVQSKVGVGTDTPVYSIDVIQHANTNTRIRVGNGNTGSAARAELYLTSGSSTGMLLQSFGLNHTGTWSGTTLAKWMRLRADANANGLIVTTGGSDPLLLGTADAERMRITSSGNVGIGTNSPSHRLTVQNATSYQVLRLIGPTSGYGYGARLNFGDGNLAYIEEDLDDTLTLWSGRTALMNGPVGVGTKTPATKFHVVGNRMRLENGGKVLDLRADGSAIDMQTTTSDLYIHSTGTGNDMFLQPYSSNGRVGIRTTAPASELDVNGTTRTRVLQITGGADVAEPFLVRGRVIEAGMVVAIDPDNPGHLRIADRAYDRTVAGAISGAGGIRPGLILEQEELPAGETQPIALSGRVYVWVDAGYGAIQPGDLLTTSATAGHAMSVSDYEAAQGAILGKAMTALPDGTGLVLVLVTLQ